MPNKDELRIWRSWQSDFGKNVKNADDLLDETVKAVEVYSDKELAKIAANGFNAIWVHGIINNMIQTSIFPELGRHWKVHMRNMRTLITRAKKHGLRVLIYCQPPRGIDEDSPFWKKHPDVRGPRILFPSDDGNQIVQYAVCTSTGKVKAFLSEGFERLMRELPDLAGVILITASEFPSHCYGRYNSRQKFGFMDCPRCVDRSPSEVVNEIIQRVRDGVRNVSQQAQVIAWNWSWSAYENDPNPTIVGNLPKDVVLMCGFERGDSKVILGKRRAIDEYALSYVGPSDRFIGACKIARKNGLKVMAKLQIGTTHELATVASIPVLGNIYEKARNYRKLGLDGFVGCWNFGNLTSANTAAFNTFISVGKLPAREKALTAFAESYFPGCEADKVVQAWEIFGKAMDYYPFCIPFLYFSPVNYSLAYPIKPKQIGRKVGGRSWLMDVRGDNHDLSFGCYTLDEIIKGLGMLARTWRPGTVALEKGLKTTSGEHGARETDNAWMVYHVYRSAWNTYRTYKLRKKWSDAKLDAYLRIIKNEIANLEQVVPILTRDHERQFGYHIEAHGQMFDLDGVKKKIRSLKRQLSSVK